VATLVLQTVGTMLGGPVGGAIGSLIGYSIDQQIFAGGPRKGPRLGDLSVQTSTYATPIPRIYGTMRVAGSVVWATDLKETSGQQGGGKGGPAVVTYNYSVSMAVALSSRRAISIGRIWADGKLLRGAAGDFKVKTKFRFHPGSEDQPLDPLIASVEGVAQTPAYRGLALAVFEDLELAEYGNRIPFLTFEIVADAEAPAIGEILSDASLGSIDCTDDRTVIGYAAHGASIRGAIQPLVEHFGVDLVDDGTVIRSPAALVLQVDDDDLGCSPGAEKAARIELTQTPARELPGSLTLSYYDPERDYQTGSMRAVIGRSAGPHEQAEAPIVIDSAEAKALAESALARRWARRDRLTVRLPPEYMVVRPGSSVEITGQSGTWRIERATIDRFVMMVELRRAEAWITGLPSDPGRTLPEIDQVAAPTRLALFDLPDLGLGARPTSALHLAAASPTPGWRPVPIEVAISGSFSSGQSAIAETVMGKSLTALADGQSLLFDTLNALEVELVDEAHWLQSCEDSALVDGANLAVLGSELFQFGLAEPIGPGRFRLSRLLRGRRGSEWAMPGHQSGEAFALLQPSTLRAIEVPQAMVGAMVEVTAYGLGDAAGTRIGKVAAGEALRPPSPVRPRAELGPSGLTITWIRRSREGFAWLDGIDSPIGESSERYRVTVEGSAGAAQIECGTPEASFSNAQLQSLGPGAAMVSIVQIGDLAPSRAAELTIQIQ